MYLISVLANTIRGGGGEGLITLLLNPTETEMMEHVVSFLEEKFWFNHK